MGQTSGWKPAPFMEGKEGKKKKVVGCDQNIAPLLELGSSLYWLILLNNTPCNGTGSSRLIMSVCSTCAPI